MGDKSVVFLLLGGGIFDRQVVRDVAAGKKGLVIEDPIALRTRNDDPIAPALLVGDGLALSPLANRASKFRLNAVAASALSMTIRSSSSQSFGKPSIPRFLAVYRHRDKYAL
jgi:hypothetical protein